MRGDDLRARVREALGGGFLRDAREDDALWVSDLPRRAADVGPALIRLDALGVTYRLDEAARLAYLDPALSRYALWLDGLPTGLPPLPPADRLHPAYALASLLLRHPAPLAAQPLEMLRRVLKLAHGAEEPLLQAIPDLHARCAALLRAHKPLPHMAGRVLSGWLYEREERP